MKIVIAGAGAWGTALAISACRAHPEHRVCLWVRDAQQALQMHQQRCNARYLPGVALPESLILNHAALTDACMDADLVIVATPMAALRQMLSTLASHTQAPVVWLCKGFEQAAEGAAGTGAGAGALGHEIAAQVAPQRSVGVLSGPSFAQEVALAQPTALVAASGDEQVRHTLVRAFHSPSLRVYTNSDVVGVEVGGAVKNVLAIATGLCDGLGLGLNARAALVTRGLAEMTRLGLALGAHRETFMGLSGLGDLVLTTTGDLSRNRKVGLLLAQGHSLQQATQSLGHVAEGVYSARTVVQRAQALGVDMPIAQSVVALLDGRLAPAQAAAGLMGRESRGEI